MFTNCHTHFSSDFANEIFQANVFQQCEEFHSVGIHPWNASIETMHTDLMNLKTSINAKTIAIGECGIDGLRGREAEEQLLVFQSQVELAEELSLPVIIHCVKGWNEVQRTKKRMKPKQKWVYHGFLKDGIVDQVIKEQMMISLGEGILYYPKAEKLIQTIPDQQLLLETDDKQIEIREIYEFVAKVKSLSLQQLNEIVTENFQNTFTKWQIG